MPVDVTGKFVGEGMTQYRQCIFGPAELLFEGAIVGITARQVVAVAPFHNTM